MTTPPPILDYAPSQRGRLPPVCMLASVSVVLPLLYVLGCDFFDFEPDSLALDQALALPTTGALVLKIVFFTPFPIVGAVLGVLSIRRVRRNHRLLGTPAALVGIVGNLGLLVYDLLRLWVCYRGYL
jgi:hypothetical protein